MKNRIICASKNFGVCFEFTLLRVFNFTTEINVRLNERG